MSLADFCKSLPLGLTLAPIYRKDEKMESGAIATGKNPVESAFKRNLNRDDAALILERSSKVSALGLFTGRKGNGLVILDVDTNITQLRKKWGSSLDGAPCIVSTKEIAAKFVFRVPEELWNDVSGWMHSSEHNLGYEVLWGRQGLIQGVYPGSKCGKWPVGEYTLTGDLNAIPDAPGWLLAEMKAAKAPSGGIIKNKTALDLSDRTDDEVATIIKECLAEVTGQGNGSRDHWIRVGMAIHSQLPSDRGLEIWSDWSKDDPEYADEWERGNPCEQAWKSFRPGKIGLGSLIWLADKTDPDRNRFQEPSKQIVAEAEKRQVTEIRTAVLSFDEIIKQAREIQELDNPAEANHRMNALAIQAGYRDRTAIEQLLLDQLTHERKVDRMTVKELLAMDFERSFVIPDILPSPATVVIYGPGGDGKSMSAWTIGKHVALGLPFVVRGKLMPVEQGPVLILNGDQSMSQVQDQLEEVDMPADAPVHIQTNWHLKRMHRFCELMDEIKPKLVIVDSLIGCSGGSAFDENKSEFASPLYWLSNYNGTAFPATTVLVIHHANKQGGFRGTSAIRDSVDETWALKRPTAEEIVKDPRLANVRHIQIEKSRSGRSGTRLAMRMESDLTFSISDATPEIDPSKTTPDSQVDRVLTKIRTIYPRWITKPELDSDPVVGGKVAATKKALQRLVKKGLIVGEKAEGNRGKISYQAVLAQGGSRGEGTDMCPPDDNPSGGTGPWGDNVGGQPPGSSGGAESVPPEIVPPECPPKKVSADAGSASGDTSLDSFHATLVTDEERQASIDKWSI